jgi:uncharacterized protein
MRRFDLRTLRWGDASEVWQSLPVEVEPFVFGGQKYVVDDGAVSLSLTVSRVDQRLTLHGSIVTVIRGPCTRCLDDAALELVVAGDDYVLHGDSVGDPDEDEPYVSGYVIELDRWVRDLVGSALPATILCRESCRGLCPRCGADLNLVGDDHHHGQE